MNHGGSELWLKKTLIAAGAFLALALAASSTLIERRVIEAVPIVHRGQGGAFVKAIFEQGFSRENPLEAKHLQDFLEAHRDQGLTYIAVRRGADLHSAGQPSTPIDLAAVPLGQSTREIGEVVRLSLRPPERDGERPFILLEFRPLQARLLARTARRVLIFGWAGAAGVALGLAALLLLLRQRSAIMRQLEDRRRLAALGQMSATMAHEIRNPLAAAKGHCQLLVEALPEDQPARAKSLRILHELVRLEGLTSDLLDFVKSGQVHRADCDPRSIVRAAAAAHDPGRVELDLDAAPARWSLDAPKLERVLANLIRNGLQASGEGPVAVSAREDKGQLSIAVRDRGAGLGDIDRAAIFEPFVTSRSQGVGLGLTVSRQIIEAHGGRLDAEDHPEGGALFRALIPRA